METKRISLVDTAVYSFDEEAHNELLHALQQHHQRLRLDLPSVEVRSPVVFTDVWVSDLALTKMMTHAESRGKIEVMGLLLGKAVISPEDATGATTNHDVTSASSKQDEGTEGTEGGKRGYFVVTDCFALPVEGTETRVNAAEEANEYMIEFLEAAEKIPTTQKVVGWYHSHPNYGCWLSGIDVRTQKLQQQHQDPFLAIVVDPIRTLSNGCIELGAFRTFLPGEERRGDGEGDAASQLLPEEKSHDFGVHWQQYYPLRTHFFSNSVSTQLLERISNSSWPDILIGRSLCRNRSLEMRRLVALVEACHGAIRRVNSFHSSAPGDSDCQGMKGGHDALDPMLTSEYFEELGIVPAKPQRQQLVDIADQAGEMAIRALMELIETAAVSSVYRDSYTWDQRLQFLENGGDDYERLSTRAVNG